MALLVFHRFDQDRCARVAGALAYTTILALVPFTAVVFAILSVFPVFETWMERAQDFIYTNFVPASGAMVRRYLQQFAEKAGRLTVFGLMFLGVTAIMLLVTVERAFNDIWRVTAQRSLVRRAAAYGAVLTFGPVLLGLSLSVTIHLVSLPLFGGKGGRGGMIGALPFVFEVLACLLLYAVVPNRPVRLAHALVGALFAAALLELAKRGFTLYALKYSNFRAIYGAVATIPIFLIWVYLSWLVLLLGAVVTAALPEWKQLDKPAE